MRWPNSTFQYRVVRIVQYKVVLELHFAVQRSTHAVVRLHSFVICLQSTTASDGHATNRLHPRFSVCDPARSRRLICFVCVVAYFVF